MAEISWRHDGRRLLIPVAVFPSAVAGNAHEMELVEALLDTGATGTGIRPDITSRLGIGGRGRRLVATANGDLLVPEYRIRVGFYPGHFAGPALASTTSLPTVLEFGLQAHALRDGFSYALLIGMDILSQCDLTVKRDSHCILSFG